MKILSIGIINFFMNKPSNSLKFGLVVSSIIVLLNDFVFSDVPEIISFGDELGSVLSNLSLAFISSYIFYLIFVVPKEFQDKRRIYKTIYHLNCQLIGRGSSILHQILYANEISVLDYTIKTIEKDKFTELCLKTNPNDLSKNTLLGPIENPIKANYKSLIYNDSFNNVNYLLNEIFRYIPFLDSELIGLLNLIKNSTFFLIADTLVRPDSNLTFKPWIDPFFDFIKILNDLDTFNEEKIKKYL